jgi:hypothetical protein
MTKSYFKGLVFLSKFSRISHCVYFSSYFFCFLVSVIYDYDHSTSYSLPMTLCGKQRSKAYGWRCFDQKSVLSLSEVLNTNSDG